MRWDPEQYLAFDDLRLRPALDLMARIPGAAGGMVVDLGCGPGNVTEVLRGRFPDAELVGVDSSPDMLARARAALPDARFVEASIADWQPERPAGVIYSNAALFPRLFAGLAPGGHLAVQMPRNHGEASHQAMIETVEAGAWANRLRPVVRETPVALPQSYHRILAPLADRLDIWEAVYLQVLEGENPVKEWTKGTALRPFLAALEDPGERAAFEADYARRILAAYPPEADGRTLFPFRRLFIVARRAGG